ncbi:hypothetical protein H5410_059869 [Solanum commersonii]|uniref:Anthocyanin acyltransferase n=1 Tax=Solanum commersonii TaxID=4109 RepID=A0A9J5W3X8_SOLCO|nr:hypothetical protein H5410_059869 [Solanum commersonii]
MEIEILCTKLIKPCLPTPPHLQRYKLSFFDQISEKEHVPTVHFYANNNFINNSTIDDRIEQSLSKILTHVYPAAERYDKDECISYTKAKVNCKLNNFLKKTRKNLSLAALFWPHENKNIDKTNFMVSPIVTAQVTVFECGGVTVSLSGSHPATDDFSDFKFLFEWIKVCRFQTSVEKINFLSFNLGNIFPTRDISGLFKSTYIPSIHQDIIVKKFVVREAAMSRLRKKCIDEACGALTFQPSRVEIITALLWRAFISASAIINGYVRPSLMEFPLNLRSKSSLSQLNNSMGEF